MSNGKSTGCIIGGIIGGIFLLAVVGIVGAAAFIYFANRQETTSYDDSPSSSPSSTSDKSSSSGGSAERPSPTAAQQAAIAGGKSIEWDGQSMTWTVPSSWTEQTSSRETFSWKSEGTWDAAWLTVAISPLPDSIPTDISLNAMHQQALDQQKLNKYTEVRWLELDGVKGVQWREAAPESDDDVQRIQWQGYRNYNGQKQLINLMTHTRGKDFDRHVDTLYAVLYSTKMSK